jgi:glutamine amidotransferase
MCELLGMSANVPTDIRFSFAGLARRGGATGPHRDGWGLAFYDGRAARVFHDPAPSATSQLARLLRQYAIKSRIVIGHVRRANRGRVMLANTHPFTRELWGRTFSFAHNGQLKGIKARGLDQYRPVGTTDSEHAFCWVMDALRRRWPDAPPPARDLDRALADLLASLQPLGVANVLMSDARSLYVQGSTRLCLRTRRAPFGAATLADDDWHVDFAQETTPDDVVTVVATRPLTRDETWADIAPGTVMALRGGEIVFETRREAPVRRVRQTRAGAGGTA